MAGHGPAPKHPSQRRNRNPKERGEWVVLPGTRVRRPPLPRPAPEGGWHEAARREWDRWWGSPMAAMWDEADRGSVEMLLRLVDAWWRGEPKPAAAAEIRQVRDSLGLSPKGRQDRRWLLPEEDEAGVTPRPESDESPWGHLRAIVADGP